MITGNEECKHERIVIEWRPTYVYEGLFRAITHGYRALRHLCVRCGQGGDVHCAGIGEHDFKVVEWRPRETYSGMFENTPIGAIATEIVCMRHGDGC